MIGVNALGNTSITDTIEKNKSARKEIDTLLSKADNVNIGPENMLRLSKEALKLSRQHSYLKGELHSGYNLGRAMFYQGRLKEAFYVFDSLLDHLVVDSIAISKVVDYKITRSKILSMNAIIFQELSDYKTAMQYYFKALQLIENSSNSYDIALIYKGLGGLNLYAENIPKAQEYFDHAIELSKASGDYKIRFDICNEQFSYYRDNGDYQKALELGIQLQNLAQHDKMPYMNAIALKSIGEVYFLQEKFSIASSYLKSVTDNVKYSDFNNVLAGCYTLLSSIERNSEEYTQGKQYAEKALYYANLTSDLSIKSKALFELAEIFRETGKFEEAYDNLRLHLLCKDSLNEIHNAHQVLVLQSKYDLDKVMSDKELIQNKLTIQTLKNSKKNYILIGSLSIIMLMGILIILQIRKRRLEMRMNIELEAQREVIRKKDELIQKEKEENLKMELEHKNRELFTRAMSLTKQQEDMIKLIDDLKEIRDKMVIGGNNTSEKAPSHDGKSVYQATDFAGKHIQSLNSLIQRLTNNISSDTWEDFRVYFENVYSDFYNNLLNAFPNLTPNQLKLSAFLKLNFSTKDIAVLTCREVRSIESSRNRLRKQMGLQQDVNLTLFLSKF